MIARLTAALALLVLALVVPALLVPAAPAAASCVGVEDALRDDPAVAFVGDVQRRITDDGSLIVRFRVEAVHSGEVHRTQDVLVPADEVVSADPGWSDGDTVLVTGRLDEDGRVLTNGCSAWSKGSAEYDDAVSRLGETTEPLPGVDRIEPEGVSRRDLLWLRLVMGVVGLAGVALVVTRWVRSRRTP